MIDIILQAIMIIGAFTAGYGICQLRHPAIKRDKRGRFTKRKS
jgi:hypothetical protein